MSQAVVGTQGYVWHQIYAQQGKTLNAHLDEVLGQVAAAGCQAWEQGIESAEHAARLRELLPKHGLVMPSMYAGCVLHEGDWRAQVDDVVRRADLARPLGVKVIVCNPNPIAWGKPLDKSDDQLRVQAEALQALGERLSAGGFVLAYHTHDPEMRHAAREFHHMMLATDPRHVRFCLDAHWIYRGAGNSQLALYDVVWMYGGRLASLHVRQSHGGVWSEVLADGDIDYRPLAATLRDLRFAGPLIMEQCFEDGTPQTLTPLERHRRSRDYVRHVFGV